MSAQDSAVVTMKSPHAQANAPKTGRDITVQYRLVSVPIKVYLGVDDKPATGIERHWFSPAGNAVGMKTYDKITGEDIERSDIITKAQASDGEWYELNNDEIAAACGGGSEGVAEVVAQVPLDQLYSLYAVTSHGQWRPQPRLRGAKKVPDATNDKLYALLNAGLQAEGVAIVVRYGTANGPRWGAMLPGGRWCELAFATQVREPRPEPLIDLDDAEIDAVRELVASMPDALPILEDISSPLIEAVLEAKASGQTPPTPAAGIAAGPGDLLAAVTASIKEAKASRAA